MHPWQRPSILEITRERWERLPPPVIQDISRISPMLPRGRLFLSRHISTQQTFFLGTSKFPIGTSVFEHFRNFEVPKHAMWVCAPQARRIICVCVSGRGEIPKYTTLLLCHIAVLFRCYWHCPSNVVYSVKFPSGRVLVGVYEAIEPVKRLGGWMLAGAVLSNLQERGVHAGT